MPEFESLPNPVRIGLVSDTHRADPKRPLPLKLLDGLVGCDVIFHGGDIVAGWVLDALREIAPVYAVRGNNDWRPELRDLPDVLFFRSGHAKIGLLHGDSDDLRVTARQHTLGQMRGVVDCAVYGHSHRPEVKEYDGLLLVNPGSPTDPRWAPTRTYGLLVVDDVPRAEIVEV
jgi:putative phosphoesterase